MLSLNSKRICIQREVFHSLKKIVSNLTKKVYLNKHEMVLKTTRDFIEPLILFLNKQLLFQATVLTDLVVYDRFEKGLRFNVIYSLLSIRYNVRFEVHTVTNEIFPLMSVTSIFSGAGWFEREAWDMYGVIFLNNNDLRRILTDYGFVFHPLRKDFPLMGFKEIFYSDKHKRIVYVDVKNSQEYRNFTFQNP